jgi:hypothetical protein
MHPGVQEDGQPVLHHVRGEPLVRGGQAEEARETDGLDVGIDRFERPAEDLRPHVDAEARLKLRPVGHRPGRRGREGLCKVALHGAFPGLLQDRVGGEIDVDGDGGGMRLDHLGPTIGDLVAVLQEQRLLPQEPDGQEVGERRVRAARKLRLPQVVAAHLRPAAQPEQELVQVRAKRLLRQAERRHRLFPRLVGGVGRFADELREALEARDFRRQVVGRVLPPRVIGTAPTRGSPERLTLVEIARGPVAEAVLDDPGPVDAGGLGGEPRDGGLGLGVVNLLRRGHRLDGCKVEALRIGAGGDRVGDVPIGDRAVGDAGAVDLPLHRHGHPRHPAEPRAGLGQRLARLAEIGVHRDRGGERPDRRDGARGGVAGGGDRLHGQRLGHVECSLTGVQDVRLIDQPRRSLSNTALI